MKLNVALVGCGKAADQHVAEIQRLKNARLVAVCDQEPLMAEQLALRYGIGQHYSDFDRMLDEVRPDVVHVTTPPQSHLFLAMRAIDAGCHVFVEKPLAVDHADAAYLLDYTLRKNRKITIGYTYYFDPIARLMRQMVQDGVIGEVVHVESALGYDLSGPFGEPILADDDHWIRRLPGGLLQNVIDHLLDKIVEFIPDETPLIYAHSCQRSPKLGLPDELRVMIAGENTSGSLIFSSHARPVMHSLVVYGTNNTVHLDFVGGCITFSSKPRLPGALGRLSCAFSQAKQYFLQGANNVMRFARSHYRYFDGLNFLISAFYDSIIRDTPVPISYADILRVSAMTDEILVQLHEPRLLLK